MSDTKYTPGPWNVRRVYANKILVEKHTDGLLPVTVAEVYLSPGSGSFDLAANAQIIAAAPELLQALKWMCESFSIIAPHPKEHFSYQQALKAIQKAIS